MSVQQHAVTIEGAPNLDLAELEAALRSEQFIQVRRRIFRQLIESLIYEGLVQPAFEPAGEDRILRIPGRDTAGRPVVYHCRGQQRFSFDRPRLHQEPVLRIAGDLAAEADSLAQFLMEVGASHGADAERLAQFISELEQTLLKDTLAQYRRQRDGRSLRGNSYDDVETGLIDGHPYHPSYKSRIGFDYLDNVHAGPDFGPEIQPLWLAAHRQWTRRSVSDSIDPLAFIRSELGDTVYERFTGEIRRRGYDPEDYLLLPVHPWQWRERVVDSLFPDLRNGQLIPLGTTEDRYRPQQSIRTLANVTIPERAYLKLSLSIVNTSTSRILAPHTVVNAPRISSWLGGILREDPFLREEVRLVLLREVLGIAYNRPGPDLGQPPATYGVLSCIWRESLHTFLAPNEDVVPWSALCHVDVDGRPFIEPWISGGRLEEWVHGVLDVSILPIIHLLYAHGIAVEAHAQNMMLIHDRGVPHRLALKDFHDGIRFAQAHLTAPNQRPALEATPPSHARVNRNSYIETDDPQDVRNFMHDAFFFINLSELAIFLSDHYGLAEDRFWSLARSVIASYHRQFPNLQERFALFNLFDPIIQVEQLTKRRLYPETEIRLHPVRNPLDLVGPKYRERSAEAICCAPTH